MFDFLYLFKKNANKIYHNFQFKSQSARITMSYSLLGLLLPNSSTTQSMSISIYCMCIVQGHQGAPGSKSVMNRTKKLCAKSERAHLDTLAVFHFSLYVRQIFRSGYTMFDRGSEFSIVMANCARRQLRYYLKLFEKSKT